MQESSGNLGSNKKNRKGHFDNEWVQEVERNVGSTNRNKKKNIIRNLSDVQEVEKHRKNMIEVLKNSNATPIRFRTDLGYACCFCSKQYPVAADLKRHTIEEHDDEAVKDVVQNMRIYTVKLDITALRCSICKNDISTIEELIQHLIDVHERTFYTEIKNHMVPFKFESDELKCVICKTKCSTFRNLTEHMNVHYRNYVCDTCGAGFVNRDILRSHLRIHKTGTFTCDFCPKTFNTYIKKQAHTNVAHKKSSKTNKCGYCGELFVGYHKKTEHLAKVHGVIAQKHKCSLCEKLFKNRGDMKRHTRKNHLMERNFKCELCDMKFFSREDLCKHSVRHTGRRDFECSFCGKAFARKHTLNQHMKIHFKESRTIKRESADKYLTINDSDVEYTTEEVIE